MSYNFEFMVHGTFHVGQSDDGGEDHYGQIAEVWSSLPPAISYRKYSNVQRTFAVTADWDEAKNLTRNVHRAMQPSLQRQEEVGAFEWVGEVANKIQVPVIVESSDDRFYSSMHILENYLYDV